MTKRTNDTEPVSALGDTRAATSTTVPSRADATAAGVVVGGRYELVAQLGRGAHGAVYRAFDRVAETEVALKLLIDLHDDTLALMRRELAAARRVTHRGVVRVFDLVELGDSDVAAVEGEGGRRAWALSMELVLGSSLEREIERGPVTPKRLVELAELLSDALGAAHDAGVVHRDLKPQNILVRQDGSTVITDFGVSRTSQSPDEGSVRKSSNGGVTLTLEGALLGTPLYMAPEQLVGRTDVGPPADVYALGLVLYEAATGRVPHDANTVGELRERRSREPVPALDTVRPEVPARLAEVIGRCLLADPAARFGTGDAVFEALHPPKVSAVLSRRRRGATGRRSVFVGVGVGAGLVALGLSGLTLALRRTDGARTEAPPSAAPAPSASIANELPKRFEIKPKNPRRLTLGAQCEEFPSFFPDGRRIAFDRTVGTKSFLMERDLDSGDERQLTTSPMWDFAPAVSPDGRTVAFLRAEGRERTTQLLDLASGATRELGPWALRPTFAPNGEVWSGTRSHVSRVDPSTGEVRARLPLEDGQEVGRVQELADGMLVVAFLSQSSYSARVAAYDLGAGRWGDGEQGNFFDGLAVSPDGREAFVIAGETSLLRFAQGRFVSEDRSAAFARVRAGMAVSPRGDRVVWSTCDGLTNLARVQNGQLTPALDGQREWSNFDAGFLRDGRVVFLSDRDGGQKSLWIGRPGPGAAVEKLPGLDGRLWSLSVRGDQLVVGTEVGLRGFDLTRSEPPVALTRDKALNPEIDGSGNVVYWVSEGDVSSLRRVDVKTRVVSVIGPSPAREPSPSPRDGRVVFVGGNNAETLEMLDASGRARPFGRGLPKGTFSRPTFSPDASRVAVIHDLSALLILDTTSERVIETIAIKRGSLDKPIFAPDGSLYVVASDWLGDLWVADLE